MRSSLDYWVTFKELAAQENINLEVVNFSDYTQANPALSQGQLDLNLFQHLLFLANYNVSSGGTLTPIASTYVVPLSLYSRKHTSVADIPACEQTIEHRQAVRTNWDVLGRVGCLPTGRCS